MRRRGARWRRGSSFSWGSPSPRSAPRGITCIPPTSRWSGNGCPMSIGFTAFFAGLLGERLGRRAYRLLLWPLLGLGVASVLLWRASELRGEGDLRLYLLVQFFPLLMIPLLMALYTPRYT